LPWTRKGEKKKMMRAGYSRCAVSKEGEWKEKERGKVLFLESAEKGPTNVSIRDLYVNEKEGGKKRK